MLEKGAMGLSDFLWCMLNGSKQKVYRRTMAGRQKCTGREICEELFKYVVKLIQIECNDCL